MHETLNLFSSLKVFNAKGKNATNSVKCIRRWQISINALLQLWDSLHQVRKYQFLLTRRLNKDPLGNYFKMIRQQHGNAINLTPVQFVSSFKKSFLIDFLHTEQMNCAEDANSIIFDLRTCNIEQIAKSYKKK